MVSNVSSNPSTAQQSSLADLLGNPKDGNSLEKRLAQMRERIAKGLDSGKLTEDQAKQLTTQLDDVGKLVGDAMADGKVSQDERRKIHEAMHKTARSLWQTLRGDEDKKAATGDAAGGSIDGQATPFGLKGALIIEVFA